MIYSLLPSHTDNIYLLPLFLLSAPSIFPLSSLLSRTFTVVLLLPKIVITLLLLFLLLLKNYVIEKQVNVYPLWRSGRLCSTVVWSPTFVQGKPGGDKPEKWPLTRTVQRKKKYVFTPFSDVIDDVTSQTQCRPMWKLNKKLIFFPCFSSFTAHSF